MLVGSSPCRSSPPANTTAPVNPRDRRVDARARSGGAVGRRVEAEIESFSLRKTSSDLIEEADKNRLHVTKAEAGSEVAQTCLRQIRVQ